MSRRQNSRAGTRSSEPLAAVTFDVTHTLIHSPRMAEIYCEVLRRHGLVARPHQLRQMIPRVWEEFSCQADLRRDRFTAGAGGAREWWYCFLQRVCEHLNLEPPSPFAGAELFNRFGRADAWEIYPDVIPTLEALRAAGLRLGLVSNWDQRLSQLLAELDLARFFKAIVYSSAVGIEKPNPEIFQHCLRELGVPAARALHRGDEAIEDVEGALAAGMRAIRVDRSAPRHTLRDLVLPMLDSASPVDRHWPLSVLGEKPKGGRHVQR